MNSCCKQDVHWPYIVWNEQFESHPQKPLFYSLKECNHDFEEDHWNYPWQLSSFFLFHWLIIDKDMLQTEFHLRSIHYDTELWDSHLHDIEMESRSKKETNTYNKSSNTQLIIVVDSQLKIEGICHTVHILINITENHPLHTMSIGVETHVYLSILVTTLDATMDLGSWPLIVLQFYKSLFNTIMKRFF